MTERTWQRARHREIAAVLNALNRDFLAAAGIGFGGGTRLAMALGEYRESVDIDLMCPSTQSDRAVRQTVSNRSLRDLFNELLALERAVRADRFGVRAAIQGRDYPIKLEVLSFSDWRIQVVSDDRFPVPVIDPDACFATKLTAAYDRGFAPPYKDVLDLLAMRWHWGQPSGTALAEAERQYGKTVLGQANRAIEQFLAIDSAQRRVLCEQLSVSESFLRKLDEYAHSQTDWRLDPTGDDPMPRSDHRSPTQGPTH